LRAPQSLRRTPLRGRQNLTIRNLPRFVNRNRFVRS